MSIAAAALVIMNQFGIEDTRLPDEGIVAVYEIVLDNTPYATANGDGVDMWYGTEFSDVVKVALFRGQCDLYAIPKTAIRPLILGGGDPGPPYPKHMRWFRSWSRDRILTEGVPLDPLGNYTGRFGMQEEK